MRHGARIGVVIPAQNEQNAIAKVIGDLPGWVDEIIVADNGSTDATADEARAAGAQVVSEPEPGYGAACLKGIAALGPVDVVAFTDGDYADYPEDLADLVDPILVEHVDLVIGSRAIGERQPGALTPQQIFGNWLATRLIGLFWGTKFTDLGPFRAISNEALQRLAMADRNFGWTVEMQIKAAKARLNCREVPARYRRRIGISKVSGTLKGTVMAGYKILWMIGRHALGDLVRRLKS